MAGAEAAQSYLRAVLARFADAERAAGVHRLDLAVGGRAVQLRFAGPALVPHVMPALVHLLAPPATADLTIHLWDSTSTGVAMLPPPWSLSDLPPNGEIPGLDPSRVRANFRVGTGVLTMLDLVDGAGLMWLRAPDQIDRHEAAAPLRLLFGPYFEHAGAYVAHAAAVGRPDGGVLMGGKGGSGKSTTALLCLDAGMLYAGDDYVLVDADALGAPFVHGLYATGKLELPSVARLPRLLPAFDGPAPPLGEKAIAYLPAHVPERLSRGFPIKALLLPQVTGLRDTRLVPLAPAAALRGLAPSTILQLTGDGGNTFAALGRLVRRVPSYTFAVGTDVAQIPATIARLLDTGSAS